jgi:hypothetical protein
MRKLFDQCHSTYINRIASIRFNVLILVHIDDLLIASARIYSAAAALSHSCRKISSKERAVYLPQLIQQRIVLHISAAYL